MHKTSNLSIKQWKQDDRPREKMLSKGKQSLSDAELIAILIGSGNRQESAVGLSKRILASVHNNLNELATLSILDLMKFKGIGAAKAISIVTAITLGKRAQLETAMTKPIITSSKSVFNIMQPIIGGLEHEEFWILFLNNANKVVYKECLSIGGITGTLVDIRMLYKRAVALLAIGIVVCHNHPSGKDYPSESDTALTKKIKEAGIILDIKLIDHLIITETTYFSFSDKGVL